MNNKRLKVIIILSIIVVVGTLLFGVFRIQDYILKKIYKIDFSEYIYKYAEENEIDPLLIAAIIKAESNFKRDIKSSSGAIGLMQLMEETAIEEASEFGQEIVVAEKLYDAEINIRIGTKYIAKLIKRYDNYLLALAAYNAGMGKVDSWIEDGIIKKDGSDIENIPIKETNNYVRKIVRDYKIYKILYDK